MRASDRSWAAPSSPVRTKAPSRVCIIGPTGTTVVTANCIGDNGVLKPTGDWRDARVIVTGARGFIGSHLCRWLVDAGATVYAISSQGNFPRAPDNMAWSTVALSDPDAVRRMLEQLSPDVVFHLSGHVTRSQALADVEPTFSRILVILG